MSAGDEVVQRWLAKQGLPYQHLRSEHLHYRGCPDIEVYSYDVGEHPLSDVTADLVCDFWATWGCPHLPGEQLRSRVRYQGSFSDLLAELLR